MPVCAEASTVDGKLDDWDEKMKWVYIDRRGTKANFSSDSRPYEVSATVRLTDTQLYAAFRHGNVTGSCSSDSYRD